MRRLAAILALLLAVPASAVTRFYEPSAGTTNVSPAFAGWGLTTNADRLRAPISKTNTASVSKVSAAVGVTTTRDVLVRQYLSDPLSGAQTVAGTVKGVARALESLATANAQSQLTIRVVSKDGVTLRGTLLALSTAGATSEWATALTNRKFPVAWASPVALSSVSALDGDRISIEIGARFIATTVATTTGTINFGDVAAADLAEDETTTTANNPWLEFSQTLVFQPVPELRAVGTYLTGVAGTSAALAVPAGAAVNDIALAILYKENAAVVTPPAGFTEFVTVSPTGHTLHVFWKRLVAADSGTYSFSWTGSVWREGYSVLYKNCATTGNPYEAIVTASSNVSSTTTPAVTITPVTDNDRLFWVATSFGGGNPWTPPTNFTIRSAGSGVQDVTMADRVWNGTVSSGALTGTGLAGAPAGMSAAGFALKPAGGVVTFNPRLASTMMVF